MVGTRRCSRVGATVSDARPGFDCVHFGFTQPSCDANFHRGKLAAHVSIRGAFAEGTAVDVIRGVCAGLAAVPARGILHRDLKPANIMMALSGQPKLMDFGVAAAADNRGERRSEGTPTYMAPEQLAESAATTKSDIYALGLVMFETLTGTEV